MTRTKLGLLGICAVVLGSMVFNAGGAQAEVGAQWLFAEKAPGTKLIPFLEATLGFEKASPTMMLHTEILKIKVLFECTSIKAVNAVLKANGSIGNGAKVLFGGCLTYLNGSVAPECEPKDKTDGSGAIISNPGHGLIVLGAAKEDLIKVLPDEGETFMTKEFPASCPIGTKIPVIGKLTLKDAENSALTHLVKHMGEAGPGTELFVISKTVEHSVLILGSAWAFLTGAHEGLKISGDPA